MTRPGIVDDRLAVMEHAADRDISEIDHRIVERPIPIDGVHHQAGTIGPELADDFAVRLDETGGIRGIIPARIGHAHPKVVRRRPALHGLAHDVCMHARPPLAGIIKRLENALNFLLVQLTVKLGEP